MAKVGAPRQYQSVEEMQERIDAYFAKCDENEIPYTVSGLAVELDLTRKGLLNYEGREEFVHTIKKAKLKVESSIEAGLMRGLNATGCIFNLKNNFGWKDEQKHTHGGDKDSPIRVESKLLQVVGVDAHTSSEKT